MTSTLNFDFALKEQLAFSDGSSVEIDDLKLTLTRLPLGMPNFASVTILAVETPSCLTFSLQQPDKTIFDKLMTTQSTILKKSTIGSDIPVGLGPYRLAKRSDSRMLLEATPGRVQGDFKGVEYILVDPSHLSTVTEKIDDWNYLGAISLPPSLVERGYQSIEKRVPKIYFLHVGLLEDSIRQRFSECFNRVDFIRALDLPVESNDGLIPHEMLEATAGGRAISKGNGRPTIKCEFPGKKPTIPFFSFNQALHEKTIQYFNQQNHRLPVNIKVESRTLTETNAAYDNHQAFITLYGTIAISTLPEELFSNHIAPTWTYSKPVGRLSDLVKASLAEENLEKKRALLDQANQAVRESGFVIPLGQLRATLYYYPAEIGNIRSLNYFDVLPPVERMSLAR